MILLNFISPNNSINKNKSNNNGAYCGGMGERLYQVLNPGANLLASWLPVFFIPSLITLPLSATNLGSTTTEFVKVVSVLVGGFVFTLLTTAWSVLGIRKLLRTVGTVTASSTTNGGTTNTNGAEGSLNVAEEAFINKSVAGVGEVVNSVITGIIDTGRQSSPKTFSKTLFRTLKLLTYLSGIATVTLMKYSTSNNNKYIHPVRSAFLLFTTLSTFVFGSNLPKSFTKIVHPLVTCTSLTWLVAQLLSYFSSSSSMTFMDVLRIYKCGTLSFMHAGPGDVLLFLLGPAVIALACQMYSRRQLMQSNIIEVMTSTIISSVGGLYGTALLVRLLHICNPTIRLALLSRNITSPLAMSIAAILSTDTSLAVTMVVLTGLIGANFGAAILNSVNIHDPVARGLGMGAAAHGLGTAAIKDEGDAFPFAAISMALTATTCTCLVSVPMIRQSICKLALGI
jgi:putative effector of murein hydrolase